MFLKIKKNNPKAFTLVEMLVFMFIFSVTGVTFFKVFSTGTQAMSNVRSRLGAVQLANEKIEVMHNLKYENVGTLNGIPVGNLPEEETIVRSGRTYYVHTSVINVDDPFDGTFVAGTDTRPNDYKQIKVVVFWENDNLAKATTVVSNISPLGIEAMYTGGILSLNVVDSVGVGIPQAKVTVVNSAVSPSVNASYTTDNGGNLFLSEAIPSAQTYSIQVSKSGYFSVQTYAPYPISSVNPIDVHASVVAASINQKTIIMDKLSSIKINTVSPLGEMIPAIDFSLTGGRKVANTVVVAPDTPESVWSFNEANFNSGSKGEVEFLNVSPGPYYFTYLSGTQNDKYQFLYFDVAGGLAGMFNLPSEVNLNVDAILADKEANSLLVTVLNITDNSPLVGASVQLKNESESYDVTLTTNKFGKVYFPNSATSIVAGAYKMNISATGFTNIIDEEVQIDKLTSEEVKMSNG